MLPDDPFLWVNPFPVLFAHRKKVIGFFCAMMALTVAVTILWPRSYRSRGKFLVRMGRENVALDPMATLGGEPSTSASAGQSNEFDSHSVAELLDNRALVEKVVDAIGPAVINDDDTEPDAGSEPVRPTGLASVTAPVSVPPRSWWDRHNPIVSLSPRNKAIRKVANKIAIEPIVKSNVVVITYSDYCPEVAQAVVAKLMAFFMDDYSRLNRTRGTYDFLARQTADLHTKLTALEQELHDLKNEAWIISPESRAQKIQEQIGQVEQGLLDTGAERTALKAQVETLRKLAAALPETVVAAETTAEDKGVAEMRGNLYALRLKEQEMLASTKKDYFALPQIQKQVALASEVLAENKPTRTEITKSPNRSFEESQLLLLHHAPSLAGMEAKGEALQASLANLRRELAAFNDKDLRIMRLRREIELCDKNYRKYMDNLEQARIDQAMEAARIASINVAEPATFEVKPVWPKGLINLLIGSCLGIFGGAGLAFLAEHRRLRVSPLPQDRRAPGDVPTVPGPTDAR